MANYHGRWGMPEYRAWHNMKTRCYNPNYTQYRDYGGRGISVCDRWFNSFDSFLKDMGYKPGEDYSLDRIDNDGNYTPENCRWATKIEQSNNQRPRRISKNNSSGYKGVTKAHGKWVARVIKGRTVIYRSTHETPEKANEAREEFLNNN